MQSTKTRPLSAVFAGDEHCHLVKSNSYHTLCGLPTIKREKEAGEYRPPARVTAEQPPEFLYKPRPRCVELRVSPGRPKR